MDILDFKSKFKNLLSLISILALVAGITSCQVKLDTSTPSDATPVPESNTSENTSSEQTPAIVPEFTFTNTGKEEICELYLSPVELEKWGPDQLEKATIPAGERFVLKNIPAGDYDVKAIGCDGGEITSTLNIQPQ